ncbi:unnamed protein product [Brassica oleracea]
MHDGFGDDAWLKDCRKQLAVTFTRKDSFSVLMPPKFDIDMHQGPLRPLTETDNTLLSVNLICPGFVNKYNSRRTILKLAHLRFSTPLDSFFSGDAADCDRRKNKFVALDNGKKATFECRVKPPFVGTSKPWIELETDNIYCIFFSNSNNMKPLKGASSALLLGCLSVSGTRKTMNITSEFNNVIITILENSDVQIHRCTNESLSMSSRVDVGVPKTEVEMIVMLSAAGQKMIIRYEVDESQIPVNPSFGFCLTVAFLDFIVVIIIVKVGQRRKLKKEM